MKKVIPAFLAAFAVWVLPAFGQQTAGNLPPLPPGPVVHLRAPDFARWIVTYNPQRAGAANEEPADSGEGRAPFSRRVIYTKNKGFILEQIQSPAQPVRERWIVGEFQYSRHPKTKQYVPYTAASFPSGKVDPNFYIDLSKTDFPGIEWITEKEYAGVQKVMGRECLVFRKSSGGEEMSAYIDLGSRYPVVARHGNETRLYEFQKAPQIALPAEIQKELAARAPAAKKAR